jgi:hypothetical protein
MWTLWVAFTIHLIYIAFQRKMSDMVPSTYIPWLYVEAIGIVLTMYTIWFTIAIEWFNPVTLLYLDFNHYMPWSVLKKEMVVSFVGIGVIVNVPMLYLQSIRCFTSFRNVDLGERQLFIVRLVGTGGLVYRNCLNFLFITFLTMTVIIMQCTDTMHIHCTN